jgi:hypothetical protein
MVPDDSLLNEIAVIEALPRSLFIGNEKGSRRLRQRRDFHRGWTAEPSSGSVLPDINNKLVFVIVFKLLCYLLQ